MIIIKKNNIYLKINNKLYFVRYVNYFGNIIQ